MTLQKLVELRADKAQIRKIYISSFPSYERMPFVMLENSVKNNKGFELLGIYEDKVLIGFFYIILQNDICLILYFAIEEQKRSQGFGSKALELITQYYINYRIFLYIEDLDIKAANNKQQIKRRAFYLRNGFSPANINIIFSKNIFEVLIYGNIIKEEEYISILRKMTGGMNFVISTTQNKRDEDKRPTTAST